MHCGEAKNMAVSLDSLEVDVFDIQKYSFAWGDSVFSRFLSLTTWQCLFFFGWWQVPRVKISQMKMRSESEIRTPAVEYPSNKKALFLKTFWLSYLIYFLMALFSSAHFLHRIIILFNLSLKVLRDGKQTAELSLLKWYWTSKRVSISHKKTLHKLIRKWNKKMLPFAAVHLWNLWLSGWFLFKWPFCGADTVNYLDGGVTCRFNKCVISKSFRFSCERRDFRFLFDLSRSMIGITLFLRHFARQRGFQLTNV